MSGLLLQNATQGTVMNRWGGPDRLGREPSLEVDLVLRVVRCHPLVLYLVVT